MRSYRKIAAIIVGVAALAGTATGVALAANGPDHQHRSATTAASDSSPAISAGVSFALPYEKAADWVSYGDAVAVVTVTAERKPSIPDFPGDEGFLGRFVTLRTESSLWTRPGAAAFPQSAEIASDGWVYSHGRLQDFNALGPRLRVGHRYVVALADFGQGEGWGLIAPAMSYDSDSIGDGAACECEFNEVPRAVWGKPAATVSTFLGAAKPDPNAVKFNDLGPVQRYQKAHDAGN